MHRRVIEKGLMLKIWCRRNVSRRVVAPQDNQWGDESLEMGRLDKILDVWAEVAICQK